MDLAMVKTDSRIRRTCLTVCEGHGGRRASKWSCSMTVQSSNNLPKQSCFTYARARNVVGGISPRTPLTDGTSGPVFGSL